MNSRCAALMLLLVGLASCVSSEEAGRSHKIEEASYVVVGGIEQWVTIHGDDDRKPVLLLVHGGPGDVQSTFRSVYLPYERDFVLVQWDQRGAGRTFERNGAVDLTLDRQVADGLELADYLRKHFAGRKPIVLGHSWGSVIATGMVQRRPELFAAYVGTGQVASWADTVQFQFDFLKKRYADVGNSAGLASLEVIGKPDPINVTQYFGFSRPLRQNVGAADAGWFKSMKDVAMANGETDATIKVIGDGQSASGAALIQTIVHEDLPATASAFQIPYYVIQGRQDLNAPTPLAEAYFAKVQAPKKRLFIIENAGHFAVATHQKEFVADLKRVISE